MTLPISPSDSCSSSMMSVEALLRAYHRSNQFRALRLRKNQKRRTREGPLERLLHGNESGSGIAFNERRGEGAGQNTNNGHRQQNLLTDHLP